MNVTKMIELKKEISDKLQQTLSGFVDGTEAFSAKHSDILTACEGTCSYSIADIGNCINEAVATGNLHGKLDINEAWQFFKVRLDKFGIDYAESGDDDEIYGFTTVTTRVPIDIENFAEAFDKEIRK